MSILARLAIAVTSATLGVPPDGLSVDAAAVRARAATAFVADLIKRLREEVLP